MGHLDNGARTSTDRPVALVSCQPTALAAALVVALAERGFEVHVSRDVLEHAAFDDDVAHEVLLHGWRQIRSVDAASRSTEGRAELLLSVSRTGRPLSVAVLSAGRVGLSGRVLPDAATLATLALMSSAGAGGRLLLLPSSAAESPARAGHLLRSMAPGVSVTTLGALATRRPARPRLVPGPQDALGLARAGVDALMAGSRRVRPRRGWQSLVDQTV